MIVDWFSMTFTATIRSREQFAQALRDAGLVHLASYGVAPLAPWSPFSGAIGNEYVRIQWQRNQTWSHLSITGTGCALDRDALHNFIYRHADAATRIDLALDLDTQLDPVQHADCIDARTKSIMQSDAGSTLYIGSRKSNSFIRIYRYNAPHARAGITRIEAEFKSDYAKSVSTALTQGRLDEIAAFIARKSKTEHLPDWKIDKDTKPVTMRKEKISAGQDGWQRWLKRAALPAVIQALHAGVLSKHERDALVRALKEFDNSVS